LINCRADDISRCGISINGAGSNGIDNSMFSIIGGWFNAKSTHEEVDLININNSRGVSLTNVQFYGITASENVIAVKITNSLNYMISGCLFTGMNYGVHMTGSGYGNINGNRFYNRSKVSKGSTYTSASISGFGDSRTVVNGNTFDGYYSQAVYFDNTSSGSVITCNSANITNIDNRFINYAAGGIKANNSGE
jgi:hypothetical protein